MDQPELDKGPYLLFSARQIDGIQRHLQVCVDSDSCRNIQALCPSPIRMDEFRRDPFGVVVDTLNGHFDLETVRLSPHAAQASLSPKPA